MARLARLKWWILLCAAAFAAAVVGAVVCGEKMAACTDAAHAEKLRMLIYAHFALAQAALLAGGALLYAAHRRWRCYYLIVSYNEKGVELLPPGIHMPSKRVFHCHLGALHRAQLPPTDAPILVYPMFMLSGRSSGEKMENMLRRAYADAQPTAQLYYQPVLGASPWLARAAVEHIAPLLDAQTGVLVVAHGSTLPETPPEPSLFCRRLREKLGTEVCLGYFGQEPGALQALAAMRSRRVLLLPFLLTEGVHTARDLPTEADAAACGKTLQRLPVVAALLSNPDSRS